MKSKKTVHEHEIVYGQEASDYQKDMVQMKCLTCPYKSYSIAYSLRRINPRKESK